MNKLPVIFDHDGGIDDLLSLMLLLTMEHVDLKGVTITPADCFLSDATSSTLKILKLFGREDVPVAQGRLHGINPFHYDWRAQPKMVNALPIMIRTKENRDLIVKQPADVFIAEQLEQAEHPITVLMTGPCSNLTAALELNPNAKNGLERLVWMGGAVDVKGNVATHNHDGSAEWNVYWDYLSANRLLKSGINITLMPLDATNCLPIDHAFLSELAQHSEHRLVDLAGQFWACTVASIPSYEFTYFLWDVMATCVLGIEPDAIKVENCKLSVAIHEPNEGQTYRDEKSGNNVDVVVKAEREKVITYLIKQLKSSNHNITNL